MKKNYSNSINFENLQRMRDYLVENKERIEPKFDMHKFRGYIYDFEHKCGTVGCVLGWGIEAFSIDELIKLYEYDLIKEGVCFWTFSNKVLNLNAYGINIDVWDFLFSSNWKPIDNTLEGAIERLNHVLSDKPMEEHEHYQEFIKTL